MNKIWYSRIICSWFDIYGAEDAYSIFGFFYSFPASIRHTTQYREFCDLKIMHIVIYNGIYVPCAVCNLPGSWSLNHCDECGLSSFNGPVPSVCSYLPAYLF